MTWVAAGAWLPSAVEPDDIREFADHDRAQDWIWAFKEKYSRAIVVLHDTESTSGVEHIVYINNEPDGVFSNIHDAEAWLNVRCAHIARADPLAKINVRIEARLRETLPPEKPILNLWERLAAMLDED